MLFSSSISINLSPIITRLLRLSFNDIVESARDYHYIVVLHGETYVGQCTVPGRVSEENWHDSPRTTEEIHINISRCRPMIMPSEQRYSTGWLFLYHHLLLLLLVVVVCCCQGLLLLVDYCFLQFGRQHSRRP